MSTIIAPLTTLGSMVKVVFLDRDGTINIDTGEVWRVDQFAFIAGAMKALGILRDAGFKLAIVTNQRKIGEGICTEADVQNLHSWLNKQFPFDSIVYCPHTIESHCGCRKPEIGMAAMVEKQLGVSIDYTNSWMIGDKPGDMLFGKRINVHTVLIRSPYADMDVNADYWYN
jgi:D-glycero-D-manno-heptose 1,7-bisphosphate phosphatase